MTVKSVCMKNKVFVVLIVFIHSQYVYSQSAYLRDYYDDCRDMEEEAKASGEDEGAPLWLYAMIIGGIYLFNREKSKDD